jgi:hypothetical protein
MKVQDVTLRAIAKSITWWQAAEIIGISDRSTRRWKQRYLEHGYDGLWVLISEIVWFQGPTALHAEEGNTREFAIARVPSLWRSQRTHRMLRNSMHENRDTPIVPTSIWRTARRSRGGLTRLRHDESENDFIQGLAVAKSLVCNEGVVERRCGVNLPS